VRRRELLFLILFAASGYADTRKNKALSKKKCAAIKQRIKRLESRLRQGHSGKQGRTMKQQARELQQKRYRLCR